MCFVCQQIDNLEHYFFYCRDTKYFWNQVEKWLSNLFSISVNLTVLEVLLGVLILMHTIVMLVIMSSLWVNISYVSPKRNKKTCFFIIFNTF